MQLAEQENLHQISPDEKAAFISELKTFLPHDAVYHEAEDLRPYECDGLSAYRRQGCF